MSGPRLVIRRKHHWVTLLVILGVGRTGATTVQASGPGGAMTLTMDVENGLLAKRQLHSVAYLPAVAVAVDAAGSCLSLVVAASVRSHLPFFDTHLSSTWTLRASVPFILAIWLTGLAAAGSYRPASLGAGTDEYRRVAYGSILGAAGVGIACYLMRWELSRGVFVIAFLVGAPLLTAGRGGLRAFVHRARVHGHLSYRVVIAGAAPHVDEIATVFRRERWLGYNVVGSLVPGGTTASMRPKGTPVIGSPHETVPMVEAAGADILFVASGAFASAQELRRVAWQLEDDDVEVIVAPSVTDVAAERIRVRPVGGLPLIHLERPAAVQASRSLKRIFDIVCAGTALLLLGVPMLLIALRVRRHDSGPVLFRQARVGRDGTTFTLLKFRTMVVDAEAHLAGLQRQVGHTGGLFKMKQDPRITRPGSWLRRYSLDELPQLLNILCGDMSLVGPRPPLRAEVDEYDDMARRRLRVRPGLTGLWQVSGRSDLSWEESVRLDLYYVDNWSMLQDLSILGRTLSAVLATRGAY
jgi:exopolysaccharide biosynthesis polyprenyl glycosylphosphotransferase